MTKVQRNNYLHTACLDDQICIFEPDRANYLTLNNVGSFIWSKIEKPIFLDDLYKIIIENYDCKKNNINFELIKDNRHRHFLDRLSEYSGLVFMTGHLETCCRIIVEAKMLNLKVITQKKLIGAASEESFKLNGEQLVDEIRRVSANSINLFFGGKQ